MTGTMAIEVEGCHVEGLDEDHLLRCCSPLCEDSWPDVVPIDVDRRCWKRVSAMH